MEEFNDKSQTMKFTPPHEEKQHIERTEDNIYSHARKNNEYYPPEQESDSSRTLVYVALILAILLIIAVTVGLIVLNMDNFKNNQTTPPDDEIVTQSDINEENKAVDEKEEEKDTEEEIKINYYNVVFYSDSIIEKDNGYSILADLFDESMNKLDNRKLFINEESDIRESGKRLSPEGLVYVVESTAGESIVFEAQIRENDDVVVSISFDGNFEEETSPEEEPVENEGEEENPPLEEETDDEITIPEESEEGAGLIVE